MFLKYYLGWGSFYPLNHTRNSPPFQPVSQLFLLENRKETQPHPERVHRACRSPLTAKLARAATASTATPAVFDPASLTKGGTPPALHILSLLEALTPRFANALEACRWRCACGEASITTNMSIPPSLAMSSWLFAGCERRFDTYERL